MPLTLGRISWLLVAGYLLLALFNYSQGYLAHLDQRIRGIDSVYYYVYLPSLWLDRDVDFTNQMAQLPEAPRDWQPTANGRVPNAFSMGPALFWSPFFLAGHGLALAARALGWEVALNGFSPFHFTCVYVGDSLLGLVGLLLTARLLWGWVPPWAVLLATLGLLGATPLTHYLWSFTAMSHNVSFLASALFLLVWRRRGLHPLTALCGALLILARWQEALLLVIPALHTLARLPEEIRTGTWRDWLRRNLLFVAILTLGILPQSLVWNAIYDTPLLVPQGQGFLDFGDLPLWEVLFSTRHGLFSWHPLLLAGVAGMALLWRRDRLTAVGFFLAFGLQWIVNAAVDDWWAGWSFGQRRFMGMLPLFALGLGLLAQRLGEARRGLAWGAVAALTLWNLLFNVQFMEGVIPRSQPLTLREMVTDKFRLGALKESRAHALRAHEALRNRDLEGIRQHALRAHALAPEYPPARAFFVFAALMGHDRAGGRAALTAWLKEEPAAQVARWAMAEFLVMEGNHAGGLALFPPSGDPLEQEIRHKLEQRAPSLLDKEFLKSFDRDLSHRLFE